MYHPEFFAIFIVDKINHDYSFLCAYLSDDFSSTGNIRIESLISTGSDSIVDFVYRNLDKFCRCHLVFRDSDDSANVSYWKVV